jgi:GT2 family glycosyltransferase
MAGNHTAVVIVNYHSQALVCRCIESLKNKIRRSLDLVVVDNSTRPDTDCIESRFPNVARLRPGTNTGFAGGCNIGIRHALERGADYILLLNPDTCTEHDFVEPLIAALRENDFFGMVGPRIIEDRDDEKVWFGGGQMNWWLGGPKHKLVNRGGRGGAVESVPFLTGCALMIRARAIRDIGPMDDRYIL